jgi:hypothetical protein
MVNNLKIDFMNPPCLTWVRAGACARIEIDPRGPTTVPDQENYEYKPLLRKLDSFARAERARAALAVRLRLE